MRALLLLLLLVFVPRDTLAGAWARDEGELFIAAGGNFLLSEGARLPVHYDPTLYAEYGLSERVTVGMDLHTADAGRIGTIFLFASFPIGDTAADNKFAASLALGSRMDTNRGAETLMRGGLSWGRGLANGWLAVDATATYSTHSGTFRPKIDATWGHRWNDRWRTMTQLQTGQGFTDDYYAKIALSVIYDFSDHVKLHLGSVHAMTGDKGSALRLETWLTF